MKLTTIILATALLLGACRTTEQRTEALAATAVGIACGLTFGLACMPVFFVYDEIKATDITKTVKTK